MDAQRPDASVRVAWPADAVPIAALQVASWRQAYAGVLPADLLHGLSEEQFAASWTDAITRPREARQRVLVALEGGDIRGFATTGPSADPDADPSSDAEVGELVVSPEHRGAGHGSRLLHAVVDTLRADRFARATMWLAAAGDDLRGFLVAQGWAPDGAYRELDLRGDGAVTVKQIRLHTDVRAE